MKILLILFSCVSLFIYFGTSVAQKNDWHELKLKGKIKSLRVFHPGDESPFEDYFLFSEKGNIIEEHRYSEDRLIYKHIIKYDEKGNKTEENHYYPIGNLQYKKTSKYDEKGNIIEESMDNHNPFGGMDDYIKTSKYDEKGNKIEESMDNKSDGKMSYKESSKYDEKGNKIEWTYFRAYGPINEHWTYKYDEKNNQIEARKYDPDGICNYKETSRYDEKGNKIAETTFNVRVGFKNVYKYDEKSNIIEEHRYSEDRLIYKHVFKYDENGNEIEEKWYYGDGSISSRHTYKYDFDKQGNWVEKQFTITGEEYTHSVKRALEYY